jgi:hypothetical protein
MYQAMAAFAAGLIITADRWTPAMITTEDGVEQIPVWGIDRDGGHRLTSLVHAHRLSILGALRAAQEHISNDARPYNSLYRAVCKASRARYQKTIHDLDHEQCVAVLLAVAKRG